MNFPSKEYLQRFNFLMENLKRAQSSRLMQKQDNEFIDREAEKDREKIIFVGCRCRRRRHSSTPIIINISVERAFCHKKIVTGMLSDKKVKQELTLISWLLDFD